MTAVPKVSIVITAHNYARYLVQSLESALRQQSESFEVVVVDDGSTDRTPDILRTYASHPRVRALRTEGVGLAAASNLGLRAARGRYLVRLDADDWFDENLVLVESNILDLKPEIAMVYPDYYLVDRHGRLLEHVRLQKVHEEIKLLDRSPLAAGAMFRRECYEELGGYDEQLRWQEDYDFWLRFTERFQVYNVNLPLLYYRQHASSMSTRLGPRLAARRDVKRAAALRTGQAPVALGVIPARAEDWHKGCLALQDLAGKPVLAHAILEARRAAGLARVIVSTDSPEIAACAREWGAEVPVLRPAALASSAIPLEDVLRHMLGHLEDAEGFRPDIVLTLQIGSPFRRAEHIQEAIDSLLIHGTDSVISVYKDYSFHWRPGQRGLRPLFYTTRLLRRDKDTVYRENGAIYAYRRAALFGARSLGRSVGHLEMLREESVRLRGEFDLWIAERMLREGRFVP